MKMLAVLVAVLLAFGAGVAVAGQGVRLVVNGQEIDAEVVIKDGRSYVPLRVIVDALGATVQWDGESRTITIDSKPEAPVLEAVLPLTQPEEPSVPVQPKTEPQHIQPSPPTENKQTETPAQPSPPTISWSVPSSPNEVEVVSKSAAINGDAVSIRGVLRNNTGDTICRNQFQVEFYRDGKQLDRDGLVYDVLNAAPGDTSFSFTARAGSSFSAVRIIYSGRANIGCRKDTTPGQIEANG